MKKMKRVISVMLASLMLSNFYIAKAEGDNQILSLQFAEDGTVTDAYNNELSVYGSVTPRVMKSMTGDKLVLDSTGSIEIDGTNLVDADEMTFETWISINSSEKSTARRMFVIRDLEATSTMAEVVYAYTSSSSTAVLKNRLATVADSDDDSERWIEHSTDDIYEFADTWRHYSFTRKWDEETSMWITKTYINGTLVDSSEEEGVRLSEEGCKLYVGSNTTKVTGLTKGLKCSFGAFNVYGKELSDERIKEIYESSKNDYRVAVDHMNLENVTPASGTVSDDVGKITLKFSNFIDASTVEGNVVFSKEDGSEVEGWSVEVRDDIFIDITLPTLAHREKYKLTITSGLMSQNAIAATDTEIKYTARKGGFIIDEDFMGEQFVVGQKSPSISGIQFVSKHVNNSSEYIKVGQTEKGTKYLRLSPVELNKSEAINLMFNGVEEGCPVIEYKVRIGGDDSIEPRTGMLNGVNGTYLLTLTNPIKFGGNIIDTDEEGFAHFKTIIKKNKAGFYQYELHYTSGGEEKVADISFDAKMVTTLSRYNIIQFYQTKGAVSPDNYLDLSYIGYYILNEPKVVDSNLTSFDTENDDTVTVTFNDPIKEETISEETVKLVNMKTDSVIPWEFVSYDAETKTAEFLVDSTYLDYDSEYAIDCLGTETEEGIKNAVTARATFATPALDPVFSRKAFSQTEAGISFSATVESEKKKEVNLVAVLYDLNSRAVQVKTSKVNVNSSSAPAEILMDYPSIEAGYTLKVIAAENDNGNLKPITKMPLEYQVK